VISSECSDGPGAYCMRALVPGANEHPACTKSINYLVMRPDLPIKKIAYTPAVLHEFQKQSLKSMPALQPTTASGPCAALRTQRWIAHPRTTARVPPQFHPPIQDVRFISHIPVGGPSQTRGTSGSLQLLRLTDNVPRVALWIHIVGLANSLPTLVYSFRPAVSSRVRGQTVGLRRRPTQLFPPDPVVQSGRDFESVPAKAIFWVHLVILQH